MLRLPTVKGKIGGATLGVLDVVAVSLFTWSLIRVARSARRRARTTRLKGPHSNSLIFGFPEVLMTPDGPEVYEAWAEQYGPVFQVPAVLGTSRIVLCDPKAIAHFYARETTTYILTPLAKFLTGILVGRASLLTSHGGVHKRLRKSLTPAFSVAALRKLLPIFYDSVYKTKAAWDNILDNDPEGAVIEVEECLDTIGIAGFSHDFGSLDGKRPPNAKPSPIFGYLFVLAHLFPALLTCTQMLHDSMGMISGELLARTKQENEGGDKSIIGLLLKAEDADSELHMSQEEVMAQMKVLTFRRLRNDISDPVLVASSPSPITCLSIPRGTIVTVPLASIDRSASFWGPDAKEFRPERWIGEGGDRAGEGGTGHKHILSFADGPRTCLGKGFAVAEFKAVLSVLIRNFMFEFTGGPDPKVDIAGGILPRPKLEGEEGSRVPLRVKRAE
ncbi:cytochrome P450 [Melanogaster broomeanus]|nr:cytochrome P450 [Melanogaster broomeanus]